MHIAHTIHSASKLAMVDRWQSVQAGKQSANAALLLLHHPQIANCLQRFLSWCIGECMQFFASTLSSATECSLLLFSVSPVLDWQIKDSLIYFISNDTFLSATNCKLSAKVLVLMHQQMHTYFCIQLLVLQLNVHHCLLAYLQFWNDK